MRRDKQPGLRTEPDNMRSDERGGLRPGPGELKASSLLRTQSSILSPQSLEIHIEELLLHGFAPGDRYGMGKAIERELARVLAEQGVPPSLTQGGEVARLIGGGFEVALGSRADTIGAQIAQALYEGLNR